MTAVARLASAIILAAGLLAILAMLAAPSRSTTAPAGIAVLTTEEPQC